MAGFDTTGSEFGTALRHTPYTSGSPGYASGDAWALNDYDAPTEAFSDMLPGVASSYSGGATHVPSGSTGGMSRELRVVFGILCILGGLVSGAGAIILALAQK